jgi:hypothetical protein
MPPRVPRSPSGSGAPQAPTALGRLRGWGNRKVSKPAPSAAPTARSGQAAKAQISQDRQGTIHSARWQRLALSWLLLALVLVPALGRLHQVLHAKPLLAPVAGVVVAGDSAAARQPSALSAAHQSLTWLLAPHAPAECVLLDQLALGVALPTTMPLPPAVPPAHPVAETAQRSPPARPVAHFWARGPPAAWGVAAAA